jgi:hypothetical protein
LLVWHGQQISQAEYQSHKAAHGVVRIVNLAEWLEDDMQIGLNQAAPQEAVG